MRDKENVQHSQQCTPRFVQATKENIESLKYLVTSTYTTNNTSKDIHSDSFFSRLASTFTEAFQILNHQTNANTETANRILYVTISTTLHPKDNSTDTIKAISRVYTSLHSDSKSQIQIYILVQDQEHAVVEDQTPCNVIEQFNRRLRVKINWNIQVIQTKSSLRFIPYFHDFDADAVVSRIKKKYKENQAHLLPSQGNDIYSDTVDIVKISTLANTRKPKNKVNMVNVGSTKNAMNEKTTLALVGMEVKLNHVLSDLIYFDPSLFPETFQPRIATSSKPVSPYMYVFNKDTRKMVLHPAMSKRKNKNVLKDWTIFCYLESIDCRDAKSKGQIIYQNILHRPNGSFLLMPDWKSGPKSYDISTLLKTKNAFSNNPKRIVWRHINATSYIALLVADHLAWHLNQQLKNQPDSSEKDLDVFNHGNHNNPSNTDSSENSSTNKTLHYHRLDILPPKTGLCRHFWQPATLDSGTIYLYPSSFEHPSSKDEIHLSREDIQRYIQWVKGNENSGNIGIKPVAKLDLALITQITDSWRNSSYTSVFNNYIVRRFISTMHGFKSGGVYYAYPGTPIPSANYDWDPRYQEWFLDSLEFPDRVVMSSPRLDAGGAGYVVTLSHSIKYPTQNGPSESASEAGCVHFPSKQRTCHLAPSIGAVMGMDLSLGLLNEWIQRLIPYCNISNTRCFLFDNHGYLIVHPSMFYPPNKNQNSLRKHLTHIEPLIANDLLLNHGSSFVKKKVCKQLSTMTMQRYYEFDTNHRNRVVHNKENGEHCSQYEISVLEGTNLFLGVVNVTCENEPKTFCPCNIRGRKCIVCNSEASDTHAKHPTGYFDEELLKTCECPCECDILSPVNATDCSLTNSSDSPQNNLIDNSISENMGSASYKYQNRINEIEDCPLDPESPPQPSLEDNKRLESAIRNLAHYTGSTHPIRLPKCFDTECSAKLSRKTCFGVIGCSWCELDYDSTQNILLNISKPFCAEQNICFSGILNGYNPYNIYTDSAIANIAELGQDLSFYEDLRKGSGFYRTSTGTSVGPVAAAILGIFLVIAGSVFCYHTNVRKMCGEGDGNWTADTILSRTRSRVIIDGGGDNLFTGDDDDNCEDGEELKEMNDVSNNKLESNDVSKNNIVISPYRMNPTYRRPNNIGTDSDQGYSTFECSTVTPKEINKEKHQIYMKQDDSFMGISSHIDTDSAENEKTVSIDKQGAELSRNLILPYTSSISARDRLRRFGAKKAHNSNQSFSQHLPTSMQSVTSGVSSRTSSPVQSITNHSAEENISDTKPKSFTKHASSGEMLAASRDSFTTHFESPEDHNNPLASKENFSGKNDLLFLSSTNDDVYMSKNLSETETPNRITVSATVHRPQSTTQ